jgi:hypothetical protein
MGNACQIARAVLVLFNSASPATLPAVIRIFFPMFANRLQAYD